jgi:hypothetical protein
MMKLYMANGAAEKGEVVIAGSFLYLPNGIVQNSFLENTFTDNRV